ncbi:uncharacterized protein C19orf85 homolog [Danio rerio]|uniref:Uncharacterized protein C19orf85 homolog n=7 Tax=Danio rerio TaxID=7955 RepID=A0AC58HJD5_DANRE
MRPSSILTFEPGLEHGVPWGRDLFTFVTSAAGHMMRTLQRPRKNKPSKRQVNHRRFLHNMIQRKFAEIEAANHQLASVLFSIENPPSHLTSRPSHIATQVTDQSPKPSKRATETFTNADKSEGPPDQRKDACDLWTLDSLMETRVVDKCFSQYKSFNNSFENTLKNQTGSLIEKDNDFEEQAESTDLTSLDDSVSSWIESIERTRVYSKPCLSKYSDVKLLPTGVEVPDLCPPSPVISLLSLDSCDLEVQMLIDAEHDVQTQEGTIVGNLQMDIMEELDLLVSSNHHEALQINNGNPKYKIAEWLADNEEDLEKTSLIPNPLDSGYDLENPTGSGSETNNFTASLGQEFDADRLCNEEPKGHGFHHNQMIYSMNLNNTLDSHLGCVETCLKMNEKDDSYSITDLSIMDDIVLNPHVFSTLENQLGSQSKRILSENWEQQPQEGTYKNYSRPEKDLYILIQDDDDVRDQNVAQNQSGLSVQCPTVCSPEGFCYHKEETCFYSKFENFEGVARSFPATSNKIQPTPILTPPLDDDWLFNDIVAEEVNMSKTFGNY